MKAVQPSVKQVVRDGQAAGAWLTERAPHVLLAEFSERKIGGKAEASERVSTVMDQLRAALGVMATDPDVASMLQALDGAIWDCAAEHEDRAWHTAWTLAIGLKGGR